VVVPTSQPFGGFVKTLLERQEYPDLRSKTHLWQGIPRRVEVESGPLRPYDVAGWTLPLQLGLENVELDGPASGLHLTRLQGRRPPALRTPPQGPPWFFSRGDGASWMAVNALLARGVPVEMERGGEGRFVVRRGHEEEVEAVRDEVYRRTGVRVGWGGPSLNETDTRRLHAFRVGLYRPWQGSMDEGWIRWILEHYHFPVVEVRNDRMRAGRLGEDLDILILPSLSVRAIMEGNPEGRAPSQYVGGIGELGLEDLKTFAREGGTLFFHDGSVELALQVFGIPVQQVSGEAREGGFYSAGSIMSWDWEDGDPLTMGMDPRGVAFMSSRASLLEVGGEGGEEVGDARVMGAFPEEGPLLLSGYLEGEEAVLGKGGVVVVPYGRGRLILVGFSLHNRAQTVANFKLLFNAIATAGG
jgi:hypothetical protein